MFHVETNGVIIIKHIKKHALSQPGGESQVQWGHAMNYRPNAECGKFHREHAKTSQLNNNCWDCDYQC